MENIIITFQEPWFKSLEDYKRILELEYNTDTSAGHPVEDDDIVRYSEETQRIQDKELEY